MRVVFGRRQQRWWIGVLALAGTLLPATENRVVAEELEGRVSVVAEATVDSEEVRLGDIAHLEGSAAEALADIEVARAPSPGSVRTLSGASVLGALKNHGLDLARVRYVIPRVIRVRRRAQEVSVVAIRSLVEQYVTERLREEERRATLRGVEVPGPVRLAPGPYETRVHLQRGTRLTGRSRVLVEFLQRGRVVETIAVMADIAVYEEVYVTRRGVPRGTILGEDDVVQEWREVSKVPRGTIARAEDVVGKEAKMALPALAVIRHDQLEAPSLVHRGMVVTLLAESAGLRITAPGLVREDGPAGGQVRVLNRSSNSEVVGRVIDRNTVGVTF